jgi:hypothetical protein
MAVDVERILMRALDAYLRPPSSERDGRRPPEPADRRRHGGARSLAVGVALGAGAQLAYRRLRRLDVTRVAGAVERRLMN